MAKEIKVKTIIVTSCEGERNETAWESLNPEEKSRLAIGFTDRFMSSVGYERETA